MHPRKLPAIREPHPKSATPEAEGDDYWPDDVECEPPSEAIGPHTFSARPILPGIFREPFWFRLPLVFFVLPIGAFILTTAWEVARSREWLFVAVAVLGLEPLGAFLLLTSAALLAPATFARLFASSHKRARVLIATWLAGYAAIALLIATGILQ